MRKRVATTILAASVALGGGAAFADHQGPPEPSQHCGGNPGQSTQAPPVKAKVDASQPGVCFNAAPFYKGAVVADVGKRSVVLDGDSQNATSLNKCADGYVGVHAGGEPHLVWSQGSDYDPSAGAGDGGVNANGTGHPHDEFDKAELEEMQSCVFTPPQ
ncbi:MAG: hypothetical protein ACRDJM_06610 [Actinomycetota bacterium]